jgi:hypothetical protein
MSPGERGRDLGLEEQLVEILFVPLAVVETAVLSAARVGGMACWLSQAP